MAEREIIRPAEVPVPRPSFTPAVRYGPFVFLSGLMATDFKTGLAPQAQANPAVPLAGEPAAVREARHVFTLMERLLRAAGTGLDKAVRLAAFPTRRDAADGYRIALREAIEPPGPPSTAAFTAGLMVPACSLEVEVMAVAPDSALETRPVAIDHAPAGRAAAAMRAGDFAFVSGRAPTGPQRPGGPASRTGAVFETAARALLEELARALAAAGSSLRNVVKAEVCLDDLSNLPWLERVWRAAFPDDPPARMVMPMAPPGPGEAGIEIFLLALADDGRTRKEVVRTDRAPAPLFHEAQAVRAGDLLFLSTLMAADGNGLVASARPNPAHPFGLNRPAAQMEAIMAAADAICTAGGTSLGKGLRMVTMHTDLSAYAAAVERRRARFPDGQPATTSIAVPGPLAIPGCTIAVDLWVGA